MTMKEIRTASELDALPVGSVVSDREGAGWWKRDEHWFLDNGRGGASSRSVIDLCAPLTVLFRPDAPQPATESVRGAEIESHSTTTDDAVERAARAMQAEHASRYPDEPGSYTAGPGQPVWRHLARAALAAARAGEAVDRDALAAAIWPEAFALTGVRDEDGEPMTAEAQTQARRTADRVLAFLAARGDAAPTVSAERAWDEGYAFLAQQAGGIHDGESHNPYREVTP